MSKYLVIVKELTSTEVEVMAKNEFDAKRQALEIAQTHPLEWESEDGCYIETVYELGEED